MGTRIMVIQLKELIKTVLFVLAGVALIIMLIYFIFPKDSKVDEAVYAPGTYTASFLLDDSPVEVSVTVSENKIEAVGILNMTEAQSTFYPLIEPTMETLSKEIVKNQTLEVSVPKEAETTANIILNAIYEAVDKAQV